MSFKLYARLWVIFSLVSFNLANFTFEQMDTSITDAKELTVQGKYVYILRRNNNKI